MYAVVMFLDENTNKYVKSIWKGLFRSNIDSSMITIPKLKPHITLAVYDDLDTDKFLVKFKQFNSIFKPIDINFDILGTFPSTNICFIKPTVTAQLLKLHTDYYKILKDFNSSASAYYLPNKWSPHCTLAINLTEEKLIKTFEYCLEKFKPFSGKITGIGLFELFTENNKIADSNQLF